MLANDGNTRDEILEAVIALEAGWVSIADICRANAWRNNARPKIGKLAMSRGLLTVRHVFEILSHQAISGGLFGETAVELGYLCKGDLLDLLQAQAEITPRITDALLAVGAITWKQSESILGQAQIRSQNSCKPEFVDLSHS